MMTSSSAPGLAVAVLEHDLRARNGQLEAFAAHVLDQDRELKLAAAGDRESFLVLGDRRS